MSLTAEDVVWAYRWILGREPEGPDAIAGQRAAHPDRESLRTSFLGSPGFRARHLVELAAALPLDAAPLPVQDTADPATLAVIVARTAAYWSSIGETAPHYSVLTDKLYRPDRIAENEAQFFATGQGDLHVLRAMLHRAGRPLEAFRRCLEYGCGVGRLTAHLAQVVPTVIGLDISLPHLELARATMARQGISTAHFLQVTPADLHPGPDFDLWFSRIVLQHNPPPVIRHVLDTMFAKLQPGGVAVFQVPTHHVGYRFIIAEYLAETEPQRMEMHVLTQRAVLEIAWSHGCRLLEMREDTPVVANSPEWLSNTFVFEKPGI